MVQPCMWDNATLEQLAAGLLIVGFPSPSVPSETEDLIAVGVRGFILFARNIESADQVRALSQHLQDLAGGDAIIAIDHEGGRVNRLGAAATSWPSPMAWAATGDLALARRASAVAAQELSALGITLNFAPVADVLADHRNPVLGMRCFSDDPEVAAAFTASWIEGHHDASVGTAAKHFPGHGATPVDSHVDLPVVERDLDELWLRDLPPFAAAVRADVDCLMLSHVWYSALDRQMISATMSPAAVSLARNGLKYDGVIVTDCLEMGAIQSRMSTGQAVVRAVQAGADMVMVSHTIERQREAVQALADAAQRGELSRERLIEANQRSARLRHRAASITFTETRAGMLMADGIARCATTLVRDQQGFLPLRLIESEELGVLTFGSSRAQGIEGVAPQTPLAARATVHHPHVIDMGAYAVDLPISSILETLQSAATILVGTAFAVGNARQAEVVDALLQAEKRVIVIALHDPFDLLTFPDAPCYIAAFGDTEPSLDAALDVIFGVAQPRGRLPVALPGLYARGHGLGGTGLQSR